jgi:hypothetical protein
LILRGRSGFSYPSCLPIPEDLSSGILLTSSYINSITTSSLLLILEWVVVTIELGLVLGPIIVVIMITSVRNTVVYSVIGIIVTVIVAVIGEIDSWTDILVLGFATN